MGRKLSPEEIAQLGLEDKPGGSGGEVSAETPANQTPSTQEEPGIFRQYLDLLRRGSPGGGAAGGVAGGVLTGGNPLGVAAGAFTGNLAGQLAGRSKPSIGSSSNPHSLPPAGQFPGGVEPSPPPLDPAAAATDAATQGALGLALKPASMLAARAGFPRVAGVLGARSPASAVKASAPEEVAGMSTDALKNLDTGNVVGPGTVQELAKAHRLMATRDLESAMEAGRAAPQIPELSSRMSARVPGLAEKTQGFTTALRENVPPEKVDAAFRDALNVPESAESQAVMGKRSEMASAAVPQGADAEALARAQARVAAASARGVGPEDVTSLAADRAGYTKFAGPYVNRSGSPISQTVPQRISQALAPEYLKGPRAQQVLAAELASRGEPSVNSKLASMLTDSAAFKASPSAQAATEALRAFLAKHGGEAR